MTLGVDPVTEPPAKFRQGKAQEIIAEVLKTKVRSETTSSTLSPVSAWRPRVCCVCGHRHQPA